MGDRALTWQAGACYARVRMMFRAQCTCTKNLANKYFSIYGTNVLWMSLSASFLVDDIVQKVFDDAAAKEFVSSFLLFLHCVWFSIHVILVRCMNALLKSAFPFHGRCGSHTWAIVFRGMNISDLRHPLVQRYPDKGELSDLCLCNYKYCEVPRPFTWFLFWLHNGHVKTYSCFGFLLDGWLAWS